MLRVANKMGFVVLIVCTFLIAYGAIHAAVESFTVITAVETFAKPLSFFFSMSVLYGILTDQVTIHLHWGRRHDWPTSFLIWGDKDNAKS